MSGSVQSTASTNSLADPIRSICCASPTFSRISSRTCSATLLQRFCNVCWLFESRATYLRKDLLKLVGEAAQSLAQVHGLSRSWSMWVAVMTIRGARTLSLVSCEKRKPARWVDGCIDP